MTGTNHHPSIFHFLVFAKIRNPTTGITVMAGPFVYMANPSNIPEIRVKVISLFLARSLLLRDFLRQYCRYHHQKRWCLCCSCSDRQRIILMIEQKALELNLIVSIYTATLAALPQIMSKPINAPVLVL